MKLYGKYFSVALRSQMQYKTSFFLSVTSQFLLSFSAFLGIYFMFLRFNTVQGFTFAEILLCFSVVLMAFSIAECFFRGFDTFSNIISNGEFDRIMVRPRNEIFQVLTSRIEFSRLGKLLQAVVMLAYAIPTSGVVWSFDKILTLILMILGGTVVFAALFLLYAGICFFTTEGLEFMNILTDGGREFGRYPMSIYGDGVLKFFTFVVPHALFQYYPLLYLIGKTDNVFYMLLPAIAMLFALPCYVFWRFGIRHYKSTGS